MAALSKLMVELGLDSKGFDSGLAKAQGSAKVFGTAVKAALLGTVAGAVVAGVGLFKVGQDWDAATDTIITKTGASGQALTDLQNITKDVFTSIPTDMGTAANAVADLAQKTGDTGPALDALAKSEIELARITDTDLNSNIDTSAKLFNEFGVAAEDQVSTLDDLFTVSQKTGVGVDQLMSEVQRFGPVTKAMGLSVGQSANLIGKMDQAGLNTARDMKGLNTAIVTMAKNGVDAKTGLTDAYNGIKNAGSASEATAMAVKLFGKAAGPELAQAIREGKIGLDDLTGSADLTGDSILKTAAKTNDFAENFKIFKNNIEAALIPLGSLVFNGLNLLIPLLTAGTKELVGFASAIKSAFDAQGIRGAIDLVIEEVTFLLGSLADLGSQALNITLDTAVQIAGWLWDHRSDIWGGIKDAVGWAGNTFSEAVTATIDGAIALAGDLLDAAGDLWGWIKKQLLGGSGESATSGAVATGDSTITIGSVLIDGALALGGVLLGIAADFGSWLWKELKGAWAGTIDAGSAVLSGTITLGGDLLTMANDAAAWIKDKLHVTNGLVTDIGKVTLNGDVEIHNTGTSEQDQGKSSVQKFIDGFESDVGKINDAGVWFVTNLAYAVGAAIGAAGGAIFTVVGGLIGGIVLAIEDPSSIARLNQAMANLIRRGIQGVAGTLGDAFVAFWSGIAQGFLAGTPDQVTNAIAGFFKALPGQVKSAVGSLKFDIPTPSLPIWLSTPLSWGRLIGTSNAFGLGGGSGPGSSIASLFTKLPGEIVSAVGQLKFDIPTPTLPSWMSDTSWISGPVDTLITDIEGLIEDLKKAWADLQFWKDPGSQPGAVDADAASKGAMDQGKVPSSQPGTVGGELVTTLPGVGSGSPMFDGLIKAAEDARKAVTDSMVGMRGDITTIISDMVNQVTNQAVGMRNNLVTISTDAGNQVVNAFVGMRDNLVVLSTDAGNQVANAFVGMRNNVVTISSDMSNAVVNAFVGMRSGAVSIASDMNNAVTNAFVGMRNSAVSIVASTTSSIVSSFAGMESAVVGIVYSTANAIVSAFSGLAGYASSAGYGIGDALGSGIYSGMSAWAGTIASSAAALVSSAVAAARAAAGAHSPSRKMMELGDDMVAGLVISLDAGRKPVGNSMGSLIAFPNSGNWSGGANGGSTAHNYGGITINVTGGSDPKATADEVFAVFSREMNLRSAS